MNLVEKTMMGLYFMVKASKTKETPLMNIDPPKSLYLNIQSMSETYIVFYTSFT